MDSNNPSFYGAGQSGSTPQAPASPSAQPGQPASPFGQPSQPASPYEKPSQPASPFGQPSQPASPFEQPSQPASPFGQPSQPASPFEQPSQPASPFGQPSQHDSLFGQPSQPDSLFGQPSQPDSLFGQPSQPASPYEQPSQPASPYGPYSPGPPKKNRGVAIVLVVVLLLALVGTVAYLLMRERMGGVQTSSYVPVSQSGGFGGSTASTSIAGGEVTAWNINGSPFAPTGEAYVFYDAPYGVTQVSFTATNTSNNTIVEFRVIMYVYDASGNEINGSEGVPWVRLRDDTTVIGPGLTHTPALNGYWSLDDSEFPDVAYVFPLVVQVKCSDGSLWGMQEASQYDTIAAQYRTQAQQAVKDLYNI